MLYRVSITRNANRIVATDDPKFRHRFGGQCSCVIESGIASELIQVCNLDLKDPVLSFLRFQNRDTLPLLIDKRGAWVTYTISESSKIAVLGEPPDPKQYEYLIDRQLPEKPLAVIPFSYEQLRAIALDHATFGNFEPDFLNKSDRALVRELGKSYSQVGGHHFRAIDSSPYCVNPDCISYQRGSCVLLASISANPVPGVTFDELPQDPAFEFYICIECNAITGAVAYD